MLTFIAVAQGIIAQVRVFGGSIGIAASTAILGIKQRQRLLETGIITPSQLQSLREAMSRLTPENLHAVKQAYTDAFDETLVVCAILSGIALLVTIGCWRKNPISMPERRKQQMEAEALRQKAIAENNAEPSLKEVPEGKEGSIV